MISNKNITVYHKSLDETSRLEKWERFNYNDVWFFEDIKSNFNKGYDEANNVQVRIPYNRKLDINDFAVGDILVEGNINIEINTQQDLSNFKVHNITGINNNNFGNNPHIHLSGK